MGQFKHKDIKNIDVQFSYGIHPDNEKKIALKIDSGTFAGFIVSFNHIRPVFPEGEDGECVLSFDYEVISLAGDFTEEVVKEKHADELNAVMSKIAMVLFEDAIEASSKGKETVYSKKEEE